MLFLLWVDQNLRGDQPVKPMELPFWGMADALELGRFLPKARILQHGASALDVVTLVILAAFDILVLVGRARHPETWDPVLKLPFTE